MLFRTILIITVDIRDSLSGAITLGIKDVYQRWFLSKTIDQYFLYRQYLSNIIPTKDISTNVENVFWSCLWMNKILFLWTKNIDRTDREQKNWLILFYFWIVFHELVSLKTFHCSLGDFHDAIAWGTSPFGFQ